MARSSDPCNENLISIKRSVFRRDPATQNEALILLLVETHLLTSLVKKPKLTSQKSKGFKC